MHDLPGGPRAVWAREAARDTSTATPWLPSPDDLAPHGSFEEFDRNYDPTPPWYQRWMPTMVFAFLAVVMLPVFRLQLRSLDEVPRVVTVCLAAAATLGILGLAIAQTVQEVRFRRRRAAVVRTCWEQLQTNAVPVWAVLEQQVRVGDGYDGAYPLQFVFDLRVPRSTLARQRRVVETWLDAVGVAQEQEDTAGLPARFAKDEPVHCADVFGEEMRGVWIWSKGSVYPIQVLGLALDDPRRTAALREENVVFLRDQPRTLRRLSTIGRRAR